MKENYQEAYRLIRLKEGGVSNRSKEADPGGLTKWGVTQATYDNFRKSKGSVTKAVTHMTEEECSLIYEREYAKPIRFNELPSGVDYFLFDTAIHSGTTRASKLLQRALGVAQDGRIGVQTLSALNSRMNHPEAFLKELYDTRMAFMKSLKNWKHNANGWTNRLKFVHKNALSMALKRPILVADAVEPNTSSKAEGEQTLVASISDSTRSKAAVTGALGLVTSVATEVGDAVGATTSLFSFTKYAALIGLLVALGAFIYIIYRRSKSVGKD